MDLLIDHLDRLTIAVTHNRLIHEPGFQASTTKSRSWSRILGCPSSPGALHSPLHLPTVLGGNETASVFGLLALLSVGLARRVCRQNHYGDRAVRRCTAAARRHGHGVVPRPAGPRVGVTDVNGVRRQGSGCRYLRGWFRPRSLPAVEKGNVPVNIGATMEVRPWRWQAAPSVTVTAASPSRLRRWL